LGRLEGDDAPLAALRALHPVVAVVQRGILSQPVQQVVEGIALHELAVHRYVGLPHRLKGVKEARVQRPHILSRDAEHSDAKADGRLGVVFEACAGAAQQHAWVGAQPLEVACS
jgi:hypothetical protein